jgi:hypothetical protein
MNTALKFDKTSLKSLRPIPSAQEREDTWNRAIKLYEDGKYVESILAVIDYANPEIRKKFGNASQTQFNIAHGSAVVNITLEDGMLKVHAPFLKLPPDAKIPLMRRVAEINFGVLSLPQIYLKGDELYFYYQCEVEMCFPYKVYDIFREICTNADFFDDEFVEQYGALRIAEPKVIPMDAAQKEKAWEKFQEYVSEAIQYIEYMDNKRITHFTMEILGIELRKMEYFIAPQGKLRNDIDTTIRNIGNYDRIHYEERVNIGRKFLTDSQALKKEDFMQDLYITDVFIPYKFYTRTEGLKQTLGRILERAANVMNGGDFMAGTLYLQFDMLNLFYNYDLSPDVSDFIANAMAEASGKEWKEAATLLYNSVQSFVSKMGAENDTVNVLEKAIK